jgi:UDP:flavonoid glycosyltransferase YjiC (YdhE family)
MGAEGARLLEQSFGNMWLSLIRVMQLGARLVEEAYPDVLEACRQADLVITSDSTSGAAEAQQLGKPWMSVTLQPARLPMTEGPPAAAKRSGDRILGKLLVAPTNRFRRRVGAPLVEDITSMMSSRMILLPVSPAVAAPDPKWPQQVRQTGYWFPREAVGWEPPEELLAYLDEGEIPIAVSLGVMSTSGKTARQSAEIVLEAVRRAGVRAVLQGWDQSLLESLGASSSVYCAGSLPHGWLFSKVSAVVHHGGFGTTAAGLRSGVPSIVIPHIIDQYAWGQTVFNLGAGPSPIPRSKLTAERLARCIEVALHDAGMCSRAASIGQSVRDEPDGVMQAVQLIEELGPK